MHASAHVYDTVIVSGGPAGLSAALVLGRCRRRVLLCDDGSPRNARSRELHGFLTRDGIHPTELLRLGREELRQYGIDACQVEVTGIRTVPDAFDVSLADGNRLQSRTVLIASRIRDELPDIAGLDACFGISVHHCPYCDGWEERDKTLAVVGEGGKAAALALALRTWSDRVTLCSNGSARLRPAYRNQLLQHAIEVRDEPVVALLGQTGVPGLYVAGDASRDVQFAVVAAAEGAKAAVAINKALQERAGLAVTT